LSNSGTAVSFHISVWTFPSIGAYHRSGPVSSYIGFLARISGPIDNSGYTEIKECTMREQALLPWGLFARMMLGMFGATLGKVWPLCSIVLLSGIEAQEF
jgi:hypothetical protein